MTAADMFLRNERRAERRARLSIVLGALSGVALALLLLGIVA